MPANDSFAPPPSAHHHYHHAFRAWSPPPPTPNDRYVINFYIGTAMLDGWLSEDNSRDVILAMRFHRMTMEDVVLVIFTIVPLCFGLVEMLRQLGKFWVNLGESAEMQRKAQKYAAGGRPTTYQAADWEENEGAETDEEAEANRRNSMTRPKRADSGSLLRGKDGSIVGANRQQSSARIDPSRLPAPSCWVSIGRCCGSWIPPQLWPSTISARLQSVYRVAMSAGLCHTVCALLSNCLCCIICSSICGRIFKRGSAKEEGRSGGKKSDGVDLGKLALTA